MANGVASTETVTKLLDTNANPAPLGLMGFGLTTILLNIHNAGFYDLNAMILAMGIFYGGVAQIIAGIMEWRKNNTFGTSAFTSYGLFWLTLAGIWLLPSIFPDTPLRRRLRARPLMAWFFVFWGLFTGYMFVGTLKLNRALQVVFVLLDHPLLPSRHPRFRRGGDLGHDRRLGRHHHRACRRLRGLRPDPQRGLQAGASAARPDQPSIEGVSCRITGKRSPPCGSPICAAIRRRPRTEWYPTRN